MISTKREAIVALFAGLVAACSSGSAPTAPAVPAGKVLLATFTGAVDTRNGTVTIRADDIHGPGGPRALAEITGVSVANDGGATPTAGTDCSGGMDSLGVSVRIKGDPYVETALYKDVYAQIQSMTPATGNGGCNNATLPSGLTDYGMGLWYYPTLGGSGGVAAFWAFANPTGTSFTFTGKVYGTAITDITVKTVFLTSASYDGNLGGIDGADAKCQALADPQITAGRLSAGTYMAFVSTDRSDAAEIIADAYYVRPDGVIVATSGYPVPGGLLSGSILAPINVFEDGRVDEAGSGVWTGSDEWGVVLAHCRNWSGDPVSYQGTVGSSTATDARWTTEFEALLCDNLFRLYCFQQ